MSWPLYSERECEAVIEVLRSGNVNYWTGEHGRRFEQEFARFVGVRHGLALANGTVSLELALEALEIGTGDEVIVTPRSFVASVSSVCRRGGTPVFADVDIDSQNITAATIEPLISSKTRAIMPVHLAGWPCDMPAIRELAEAKGLVLVEDCAQAHGAMIDDMPVGSFSQFGSFSFCQDKIMSTGGEGGILVTNDDDLYQRAQAVKDHGKNFEAMNAPTSNRAFRYVHDTLGTNYRMTEMQAVIGRLQLTELPKTLEKRRANFDLRTKLLHGIPGLRVPCPPPSIRHAAYKMYAFVVPEALRQGWDRDRILAELVAQEVRCFSGSCPEIYREKALTSVGFSTHPRLPIARQLGETSLMFLVDPTISEDTIRAECAAVASVMLAATHQRVSA